MRSARSTARQPRSIASTTRPTADGAGSAARCSSCGAPRRGRALVPTAGGAGRLGRRRTRRPGRGRPLLPGGGARGDGAPPPGVPFRWRRRAGVTRLTRVWAKDQPFGAELAHVSVSDTLLSALLSGRGRCPTAWLPTCHRRPVRGHVRQQLAGVRDTRQRLHLLAQGVGAGAVARIAEYRSHCLADVLRGAPVANRLTSASVTPTRRSPRSVAPADRS